MRMVYVEVNKMDDMGAWHIGSGTYNVMYLIHSISRQVVFITWNRMRSLHESSSRRVMQYNCGVNEVRLNKVFLCSPYL